MKPRKESSNIWERLQWRIVDHYVGHTVPIYVLLAPEAMTNLVRVLPDPPSMYVGGRITVQIEHSGQPGIVDFGVEKPGKIYADLVVVPDEMVRRYDDKIAIVGDPGREFVRLQP